MYVETLLTLSLYLRRAVPVGACTVASGRCGQYEDNRVEWHAESGCLQQARALAGAGVARRTPLTGPAARRS